jgi:hypothetical protein
VFYLFFLFLLGSICSWQGRRARCCHRSLMQIRSACTWSPINERGGGVVDQGQPTWISVPEPGPPSTMVWIKSLEVSVLAALLRANMDRQGKILTDPTLHWVYDTHGERGSWWMRPHAPPRMFSTSWDRQIP